MINLIKIKCADQGFELEHKPKKEDYRLATGKRRTKRIARIEGRELEKEDQSIPLIKFSFLKVAYMMQSDKGMESLG